MDVSSSRIRIDEHMCFAEECRRAAEANDALWGDCDGKKCAMTFESVFGLEFVQLLLFGFMAERNGFRWCANCGSNFFKENRHEWMGSVKM